METQGNSESVSIPSAANDDQTSPEMNLSGVDLNLLIVLEALLLSRNVTHAARRLGQAQPAVSRALARLREVLGDDLLVRSSTGSKLTSRGERLAETVPVAMAHIREVLSSRQANQGVRLSINAGLTPALLPLLLKSPACENGPLKVNTHKTPQEGLGQLRAHAVEYMLGTLNEACDDIEHELVFTEEFLTLVAFERHHLGGIRPSEEAFLDLTHIHLIENGAETYPQVADALMRYGRRRTQLFEVQDIMSAALMVSESRLALTVPRSIAGWLTRTLHLAALLPPLAITQHEVSMYWLAEGAALSRCRVIGDIGAVARSIVEHDQAHFRLFRPLGAEE
ncbi:LysR family transcriptional regulator protein (plasmid) [Rhizobium etli 8C-3]|uniref:LysR family transcriptional regulator protein n=1 Tax=Rhizobium etli 8C-3 TaxID=538025 RepID=A0A1L5PAT9_RHIET|nr:LysR family transcriptional regulator [Rhizobium etli]APO77223.1 LysR family transcriptional regulator protein [Rhizobium etli 8C-3]